MKKALRFGIIFLLVLVLSWELGSLLLAKLGYIHRDLPTYSWKQVKHRFWSEIHPFFGVWHPANTRFRHHRHCFDVQYNSNGHGMRDVERSLKSDKERTVVLGDSFVEGWGVDRQHRFTDLLEKNQEKEFLNFGVAGYFGPQQAFILYENLAKKFDHEKVIIGIYPQNDFTDNNYDYWKATGSWKGWYKPFLVGKYPDYEIIYTDTQPRGKELPMSRLVVRALREFSYGYSALAHLNKLFHQLTQSQGDTPENQVYSGYYDFTEEDWDRLRFSLESLQGKASGKKIALVLFPHVSDLQRFQKIGLTPPLSQKLQTWSQNHGFQLVDLLPSFANYSEGWSSLYHLPCDPHLNARGHALVARELANSLY